MENALGEIEGWLAAISFLFLFPMSIWNWAGCAVDRLALRCRPRFPHRDHKRKPVAVRRVT